ncbi:hypothetical protein RF11_13768 [Thelohanellus kitauei]|uniref:E3 ubiquitin-protein ligase n=1 Tax=Thelohanellus kitauei TaxID=669202 RepID=A0A0C2MYD2_THEKT|nr:hypothetical protein RF11_13768 [Thelohanellus kitauei]
MTADQKARKWCLIVFSDGLNKSDPSKISETLKISRKDAKELTIEINSNGYGCIKYLQDYNECAVFRSRCVKLFNKCSKKPMSLAMIKVHHLYSIEVFSQLTGFINEYCSSKTQIYNLLVRILTQESTLINRYLFNEKFMCKSFRFRMINQILMLLTYSDVGKIYLARVYLENIDQIYDSYLQDHFDLNSLFPSLAIQFITTPCVIEYLVKNEFLYKLAKCFTSKVMNIIVVQETTLVDTNNQDSTVKMERILTMPDVMFGWLGVDLDIDSRSSEFRADVNRTAEHFIQFCVDFDNLPLDFDTNYFDEENNYFIRLVLKLQDVIFRFVKSSISDRNSFAEKAEKLLRVFQRFEKENKTMVENLTYMYDHRRNKTFNLSRKLFIHLLIHGHVNDYLPCEAYKQVLGDENMLVFIIQPFVDILDSLFNFYGEKWHTELAYHKLTDFYNCSSKVPYLNMQLLYTLQILVSNMDPFGSLRHILYCTFPHLLPKTPIESIHSTVTDLWISKKCNFHYLLTVIFNVLCERYFIGKLKNWKESLFERRVIHFLAIRDRTREEILKDALNQIKIFKIEEEWLDTVLERVSLETRSPNSRVKFSLKPELYNIINPFHFMYNLLESRKALDRLNNLYEQNQCKFDVMEIADLKEEFMGMNKFIFSKELLILIQTYLERSLESHLNKVQKKESINLCLMCIALISKLTQNPHLKRLYNDDITYIFGKNTHTGNGTLLGFLRKFRRTRDDAMSRSIIDYIFEVNGTPMLRESFNSRSEDYRLRSSLTSHTEKLDNSINPITTCVPKREPQTGQEGNESKSQYLNLFCEICQAVESIKHENVNIFHHSTPHLCFAFIKWSRIISQCGDARVDFFENVISNPNILFEAIEKSDASRHVHPEISVSGCSHMCHLKCATFYSEIMNKTMDHLGSNSVYNCCLCKTKNNFVIPMNFAIDKNSQNVESYSIISHLINTFTSMASIDSSSQGQEFITEAKNTKCSIDELLLSYLNSPTDVNNFYLKNCSVFYNMDCSTGYTNAEHFFDRVISRSISSLAANITKIELEYRDDFPTYPTNDFRNIKINKQFSRYCFYTCGLAPALKACNMSDEEISGYLTPVYVQRLEKLKNIIEIFDIRQPVNTTLDFQTDFDRFEEFVSSFMTISAILNLNSSCRGRLNENFEYPLVRLFFWLIVSDGVPVMK